MKKVDIRIVEVKYTGSLADYSMQELGKMAWAKMDSRGDYTPNEEKEMSDAEAREMDGKVWIENVTPCNHLVYVGMAQIAEEEE